MENVYYDSAKPGSFGGITPLVRYSGANWSSAKNWLATQDAYTLHKPVRKIFPRRKTYAKGIQDLFQADLADLQYLSRNNDGYRFILTCIDVFSKRALAVPLKDKTDTTVAARLKNLYRSNTSRDSDGPWNGISCGTRSGCFQKIQHKALLESQR